MNKWSELSKKKLEQCDPQLQMVFNKVLEIHDCIVLCGHRDQYDQDRAYEEKRSQVQWPNSKHNEKPSKAIDIGPYPLDWKDTVSFYFFAGHVKAIAYQMGIKIRYGGDWDADNDLHDQSFMDLVHYELGD